MIGLNHYTEILTYIKGLADSDPLVNKVTEGEEDEEFFDKITLFPLVHIYLGDWSFGEGERTIIYDAQIGALKQRQNTNEQTTDSFFGNTNRVDNYNETSAILIRLVSRMSANLAKNKIYVNQTSKAKKMKQNSGNPRDGYIIELSIEVPNDTINLCQYN